MITEIIKTIERNKISSVEIADAFNKTGVLVGIRSFNSGHFVAGKIKYVCAYSESNWPLHEQIIDLDEDIVLFVDAFDCKERAIFGDIVSKYMFLYKRVKGVIVNGAIRDAHRIRKENYPLWCKGVTPLGCFNKQVELTPEIRDYIEIQSSYLDGSIAICDDSGCTIIPKEKINQESLNRIEFIELQEDIWYFCLDTLKWDTYRTICKKDYLNHKDILPAHLQEKLSKYNLD